MRTAKTLIRLGGCLGWSESSLGAQVILLVLSCGGSFDCITPWIYSNCVISDSSLRRHGSYCHNIGFYLWTEKAFWSRFLSHSESNWRWYPVHCQVIFFWALKTLIIEISSVKITNCFHPDRINAVEREEYMTQNWYTNTQRNNSL